MAAQQAPADAPSGATQAVLKPSDPVPEDASQVIGLDFDKFANSNVSAAELVDGMLNMGFQASSVGKAAQIINGMVSLQVPQRSSPPDADSILREHGEIQRLAKAQPYSLDILQISSHLVCARHFAGWSSTSTFRPL